MNKIKRHKDFYSTTISGSELQCKFAFPKIYFTKNYADINKRIYYNIGFLAEIGWSIDNNVTPKYALNSIQAIEITPGMSMAQGDIAFKIFHHDSLEKLKQEILKGINGGGDKIEFPNISDSPFITVEEEIKSFESTSQSDLINWSQMPLFDIILISNDHDELQNKIVRKKVIQGVKITSEGFTESIASLEMNAMASFIAIGNITDWEVAADESE